MSPNSEPSSDFRLSQVDQLAKDMIIRLADGESAELLLNDLLTVMVEPGGARSALLVFQDRKEWVIRGSASRDAKVPSLPEQLIADATDQLSPVRRDDWIAASLSTDSRCPFVLLLHVPPSPGDAISEDLRHAIQAVGQLLVAVQRVDDRVRQLAAKCQRQAAMLRIAATWQQESDSKQLLESMAEAATELLSAERASIFLWDRPRGVLVGRPAMGVEGGQLEVDASAGVVGAVLKSGQPKRWDASDSESEVNRKVDQRLEFVTRSLLAVPLDTRSGKRLGVFEVINKRSDAFSRDDEVALLELATHAAAAIENTREREHLAESCDKLADAASENSQIIGESPQIAAIRESAQRVAKTDLSVLILGKNGTGKEVLARTIHLTSHRRREPFVAVNCAALVESLLESELFGHEKGAFTDAHEMRQGKFEVASGGTLFLDEIGDMSLGGQAKLLRVLEEKVIVRVGGSTPIPIDVRVLAATNQPLSELVGEKKFREDLYFRLNVVTLELPALKDRGDDIIRLADHFLASFAAQIGRKKPRLSAEAQAAMLRHPWRGNIRELRNLIERVSYLCSNDTITPADLSFSPSLSDSTSPDLSHLTLGEATRQFQIQHIQSAINRCGRNMTEAAQNVGLHRSNLYRKMKQLGMDTFD